MIVARWYSGNLKRAVVQSDCKLLLAGVRRETHRKQRGVVIEPKVRRERNGRSVGHKRLVQNELLCREGSFHQAAHQA